MSAPSKCFHNLTVLDLFSGPGGMSRGISDANTDGLSFDVVVANDNDAAVKSTYEENQPGVDFVFGSIVEEDTKSTILSAIESKTRRRTVDVVVGGPPCKGFSFENKMTRSMCNPLNQLITHYVEMIRRTQPVAFVMENVPGLLAMKGGDVVKSLISQFREMGYVNTEAWRLNAADYGVPQMRKRAFIVGSKSDMPIAKPEKMRHPANYVSIKEALGDLPHIPIGSTTSKSDSYVCKPRNEFQKTMRVASDKVSNHIVTRNSKIVTERMQYVPPGGNWNDIPVRLMKVNGKYSRLELAHSMIYKRLLKDKPSVTITNFRKAMIIHPTQDRLLSIREAARIQTFPDDFVFTGGISNMQQQVSDAVPVMLSKAVGKAMLVHLRNMELKIPIQYADRKKARA